jgi:YD repeat-containing protein
VPIASEAVTYDRSGNVRTADQEVYDVTTERLLQRTAGGHRFFYVYDRAGNLVTQRDSTLATSVVVVTTYGYDALNRMRSVRQGATLIARYAYDVKGRRIAKRVYSAATGGTVGYTRFVHHGDQVAFETDSVGTVLRSYAWWSSPICGVSRRVRLRVG